MALVAGHRKREIRTGLHMNALFFAMSMVVLVVVAISMWKDTHPEWLAYQDKFVGLERSVLLAKKKELLREIAHPDYVLDYNAARKGYLDAKTKFDTASSALEDTEANLEEMELRLQAGNGEEGESSNGGGTPSGHGSAAASASSAKAGKSESDELDAAYGGGGGPKPDAKGSSTPPAAAKGGGKPSDQELSDLDKEFAKSDKSKPASKAGGSAAPAKPQVGNKPSANESSELDKEFAEKPSKGKATGGAAKPAKGGSGSDMDDLDKEYAASDKSKASNAHGTVAASSGAAGTEPTYEEADFQVDQLAARERLEAAERDVLIAQRTHNREVIGLPAAEVLKRQLSDARLMEAQQSLDVAKAGVVLEDAKANVKTAAEVARWSIDVRTMNELKARGQLEAQSPDQLKKWQDSEGKLQAHFNDLQRDLRLVDGRLSRNKTGGPEIEQIYVERLGAIDRCTTCHRAVEEPGFETTAEPFHTHSSDLLKWHPVERFGCVSCHGGFGNSLDKGEAHGEIIGKGKPLLLGDQVQSSCGRCHGETKQLSGEETYLAGAQLFKTSGCLGCHKVDLSQPDATAGARIVPTTLPKAGPDLDRVSEKLHPAWLVGWLQNPQSHSLDARMPNLGLERAQAAEIATYLLTQHGSLAADTPPSGSQMTTQKLAQGRHLVENLGCLGCHSILGEGAAIGPELTNIRTKVNAEWLYGWVQNPKSYFPNSRMPVFGLTRDQSVLIGNYLISVGNGKPAPNDFEPNLSDSAAKDLGAKLIGERGCAGCHDIKGFDRISAPDLTHEGDKTADVLEFGNARQVKRNLYDYLFAKISNPHTFDTDKFKGKMPMFGLQKEDAQTIAIYLMSLTSEELPPEYTKDLQEQGSALVAGRKIFEQHDCTACHRLAGVGGKVGPDLTREGEMVRPSWMFEFLKRPTRIRWWQDARMPNYHLTDNEATTLTEFFMALSNQPAPYEYTPPDEKVFPLAVAGAKFFEDLKCQSCHPLAGKQGVAGGDTKKLGPDLGMAPIRLKKDWMLRFLRDPQAFSPGTQMPTFGKPDDQYAAIIDFLMKPHSP